MLSNSGVKLYKNLKQDPYMNIKLELVRHTVIMFMTLVVSVMASFIEVYISTNFLIFFKKFF